MAIVGRVSFVVAQLVKDRPDPSRCRPVPVVSERVKVDGFIVGAVRGVGLPIVGVLADVGEFEVDTVRPGPWHEPVFDVVEECLLFRFGVVDDVDLGPAGLLAVPVLDGRAVLGQYLADIPAVLVGVLHRYLALRRPRQGNGRGLLRIDKQVVRLGAEPSLNVFLLDTAGGLVAEL